MSGRFSFALPAIERRRRSRRRAPIGRTALALLAFFAVLLTAIVFVVDRVATRGNAQQAAAQLTAGARTAAEVVRALRAELSVQVDRLAASRALQQAIVARDRAELQALVRSRDALVRTRGTVTGALRQPSLVSTASIASGERIVATVSLGLPLDDAMLARVGHQVSPPTSARLLVLSRGRIVAGGPHGLAAGSLSTPLELGGVTYLTRSAALGGGLSVAAIEPYSAISARSQSFRRRAAIAALLTLVLAAALAVPLARPLARRFGELTDGAERDPLTGLANRRTFDARLAEELDRARRYRTHVALVIVDVDNFKQVNDRYGHQVGDELLRSFAGALTSCLRELDLAARFGGEEFALVLPGANTDDACRIAEQIRQAVASVDVAAAADEPLRVTASFGAADFPSCTTPDELVALADERVYAAKRSGKDRVVGVPAAASA